MIIYLGCIRCLGLLSLSNKLFSPLQTLQEAAAANKIKPMFSVGPLAQLQQQLAGALRGKTRRGDDPVWGAGDDPMWGAGDDPVWGGGDDPSEGEDDPIWKGISEFDWTNPEHVYLRVRKSILYIYI